MQSRLVRSKKKTDKCVPLVHVVEAWSLRCVQSPHLYADVYIQTRVRQCVSVSSDTRMLIFCRSGNVAELCYIVFSLFLLRKHLINITRPEHILPGFRCSVTYHFIVFLLNKNIYSKTSFRKSGSRPGHWHQR